MAPIKFDNNIKSKMEQRSIAPSANSWDSLSNRLDDYENNQPKNIIWYVGLAASVIGILFIANSFFFNTPMPEQYLPQVVDQEENSENLKSINEKLVESPLVKSGNINEIKSEIPKESVSKSNTITKKSNEITNQNRKEDYIVEIVTESNVNNTLITNENTIATIIEDDENVNSQNSNVKTTSVSNLDSEIEQLLIQAKETVTSVNKKSTIDANNLLQDVEEDLDQSFRDKVFETLKTNIKKAATAVAERNN